MTLTPLLKQATNEDLEPLVEYLTGTFSEHFSGREVYQTHYPNHQKYVDVIESELRRFGGNTIANVFRGEGPPYDEIVRDVANKLDVDFEDSDSVEERLWCMKTVGAVLPLVWCVLDFLGYRIGLGLSQMQ